MIGHVRLRLPLFIALLVLAPQCMWSQGSAYLTGFVRDPSGATIPAATVVIKDDQTGVAHELKTTETGIYRSPALQPGEYEVRASATGFQESVTRGLVVLLGQPRSFDITMQIGAAAQTVEVLATAPLLKTEDAGLGQNVQYQQVAGLPYFSRSAGVLLSLAPTVRYTGEDVISYGASRYNVGGFTNVNIMINGASVIGNRTDVAQMTYNPSVETLQEVKISTSSYSAEFGKDAGALVQMESKSGTNSYHGGVYEYFRNEKLDTMNAFSRTRPIDRQHMFGGTVGGPIWKDKLLFFSSLEIQKSTSPAGFLLTVPTAQMKRGDFSQLPQQIFNPATSRRDASGQLIRDPFPNNQIPASMFDPVAINALGFIPDPTSAALAGNLPTSTGTKLSKYRGVNRVDWNIDSNDRFSAVYMFDKTLNQNLGVDAYNNIDPAASPTLSGFGFRFLTQVWNFSEQHAFSPTLFMTNRFVYRPRYIERVNPAVDPSKRYATTLGIRNFAGARLPEALGGDLGFPSFNFTGYTGLGPGALLFQEKPIKEVSYDLDLTYVRGKHTLKFGFQTEFGHHGAPDQSQPTGSFGFQPLETSRPGVTNSGDAIASFLLGQVDNANTTLGPPLIWHNFYYATYIQDDWKLTPKLTLNLGLRWDIDGPVYETDFRGNGFDRYQINPVSGNPGVIKFLNRPDYPFRSFYDTDYKRFAPRIGFAWQPVAKTVIRGAYGIYNTNPTLGANRRAPSLGFTTSAAFNSTDGGLTPAFVLADGFPDYPLGGDLSRLNDTFGAVRPGLLPTTSPTFVDRNWRFGYVQNLNLSVQRELPFNMVFEIAGQASLGRRIAINGRNWNEVDPSLWGIAGANNSRRPYPQFGNVSEVKQAAGLTNYYNGYVRLEKQFSRGLILIANYSYGRTTGFMGGSIYYPDLSRGVVSYNEANGATSVPYQTGLISWNYDMPMGKGKALANTGLMSTIFGGWSIGGLLTFNGGVPFGISSGGDSLNGNSPLGGRVDIVGDPNAGERHPDRWFNTSAFRAPEFGKIGNFLGPLLGPATRRMDLSLRKATPIREGWNFVLAAEAFNFTNTPQFGPPVSNLRDARFGRSISEGGGLGANTTGPYGARIIQIGARIDF
ncbi:MAG: carboxypeptidase regulatory-like domain-containing protein [Bryobacteraceae bacterium]